MEPLPIACALGPDDFEIRRNDWAGVLAVSAGREAIAGGVSFTFPTTANVIQEIRDLIGQENQCCGWMSLKLNDSAGGLKLRITSRDPMGERQIREWF